jgi:hypothetical protein
MGAFSRFLERCFFGHGDQYTTPAEAAAFIDTLVTGVNGVVHPSRLRDAEENNPAVILAYRLCLLIRHCYPPQKGDFFASKEAEMYLLRVAHLIRVGELNVFVGDDSITSARSLHALPAGLKQFMKIPEYSRES